MSVESRPRVWVLEITSWRGHLSDTPDHTVGAVHWYGKVHGPTADETFEVMYELSAREAKDLNRLDCGDMYEAGAESGRFSVAGKVTERALAMFADRAGPHDVLLLGGRARGDPQRPLAGPTVVVEAIQEFYDRVQQCGGWECDPIVMRTIVNEWSAWIQENLADG